MDSTFGGSGDAGIYLFANCHYLVNCFVKKTIWPPMVVVVNTSDICSGTAFSSNVGLRSRTRLYKCTLSGHCDQMDGVMAKRYCLEQAPKAE